MSERARLTRPCSNSERYCNMYKKKPLMENLPGICIFSDSLLQPSKLVFSAAHL